MKTRSLKFVRVEEKKHSWVYKSQDWNGGIYVPKEILGDVAPGELWVTVSKDQPAEAGTQSTVAGTGKEPR